MSNLPLSVPIESIEQRIFLLRGQKVMLSTDLAELYGVQVKALTQAVRRNADRFPDDFAFLLTRKEFTILKSQIVTSSWGGLRRALPYAFTEQGVAMLSSVIRSKRAVQMNIAVMRAFVRLRQMLISQQKFADKLKEMESRIEGHDEQIHSIFEALRELMQPPDPAPKKLGFGVRERRATYRT
jgi:phage regulator Rha-like protein